MTWLLSMLLAAPSAHACGQSTHIWTTVHALEHLPEGPLADLLRRPELEKMLINGTMFPDGGYSPLTDHPYGEVSHWEPFQTAYLDHIKATWTDLASDEAAPHVAFLLGLASHGIGDQYFDAAYIHRSKAIDSWETSDADVSTDIIMMADHGPVPMVESWYPEDLFLQLYDDLGVDVDAATLRIGQQSLHFAVGFVEHAANNPDTVAMRRAQYPWANSHLIDPDVPGSPRCLGDVIVAYWQVVWDRLHDTYDFTSSPVMFTTHPEGAVAPSATQSGIEGALHVLMGRGLRAETVADRVHLEGPDGPVDVDIDVFYGEASHVVNVVPPEVLPDGPYTLTLDEGIESYDGHQASAWSTTFHLGAPTERAAGPCGCQGDNKTRTLPLAWLMLALFHRRRGPSSTPPE